MVSGVRFRVSVNTVSSYLTLKRWSLFFDQTGRFSGQAALNPDLDATEGPYR
jgi:hypothetical protein